MAVAGRRAELLVGLAAIVLRLVHNGAMMASPLYQYPLGGHVVFLDQAEAIAGGALVPAHAFTDNSPLFPYLAALVFLVAGGRDLLVLRLVGILCDAVTAMLVVRIAGRRFGSTAGIVAGLLYAFYAPAVFFAAELIYIPYALLCCTIAVAWLVGRASAGRMLGAGVAYGLAVGLMPSLVAGVPLLTLVAAMRARAGRVVLAAAALAGVAVAIAPVTALNYAASGRFVLLTMSSGHAFYLGHNPQARAGYFLPDTVGAVQAANRGSIFDSMHRIAEETEGHPIPDEEVSGWYFRKAVAHMVVNPGTELRLFLSRIAAFVNWFEATTYADFYFQRERSPLLRLLPTFTLLFPLAMLGLVQVSLRRELPLLFVPITSLASVLAFFYLARFRMPAIPFLCCFAGRGVAGLLATRKRKRSAAWAGAALVVAIALVVVSWPMVVVDTSNEWNKEGAVLMALKRYPDAESAFLNAAGQNPGNPYAYLNLERVYTAMGKPERATEVRAVADALTAAQQQGIQFGRDLAK